MILIRILEHFATVNVAEQEQQKTNGGFMKFVTVLMSLILTGVFANAQGEPAPAPQEGAQVAAPVKQEKKLKGKKKKKHEKKTEEGMNK